MNYYNNFSNNYGRNYGMPYYQQPQYSPQSQQMQQPQQPMQYDLPIQYVGYANLKEAEAHILFPNQKALFIDKANGMVYEKVCENDGQSFITHFKKVEDKGENQAIATQNNAPTIDLSTYAKKDDLGQFVSLTEYKNLLDRFEELKKMIGGKTNVATNKQQ